MKIALNVLLILGLLFARMAFADVELPGVRVSIGDTPAGNAEISKALQVLVLLSVLSLAPALIVVMTSFTRIIIVLAMLRHAFGMPSTPPNTVLISLALFLTLFTMAPVLEKIEKQAIAPYDRGEITTSQALDVAMLPLRDFMIRQTREKDLMLMIEISRQQKPKSMADIKNFLLIPAFMLSELQTAFQIGFIIFLPFLLIDLVSASVLMAMGMIMVPPLTISLPLKILMFVLIEGWVLVTQALVGSFH